MSSGRLAAVGSFLGTTVMVLFCLAVLVGTAWLFTQLIDRAVDLVHDDVAKHSHSHQAPQGAHQGDRQATATSLTFTQPGQLQDPLAKPGRQVVSSTDRQPIGSSVGELS
jgi:hypothetical protein